MVRRYRANERGQSILEYLVVVGAIIAALAAISTTVTDSQKSLAKDAGDTMKNAGTAMTGMTLEAK